MIRTCIGAMRSTPTNVLGVEAAKLPLEIKRHMIDYYLLRKLHSDYGKYSEAVTNFKLPSNIE